MKIKSSIDFMFEKAGLAVSRSDGGREVHIAVSSNRYISIPSDFFFVKRIKFNGEFNAYVMGDDDFSFWSYDTGSMSLEWKAIGNSTNMIMFRPKYHHSKGVSFFDVEYDTDSEMYLTIEKLLKVITNYHRRYFS